MLVDLKNRGVGDVFFLVCDGQGPTGGGANVWQRTVVQTCIVHLIRSTFAAGGPSGRGRRWMMRWKLVLNAFSITFGDRWPNAENY
nr:transposase [Saccharothrix carnea]